MDDIWKNAARKVRAREKRAATHSATTTTTTTPAAAAAVTTFSTASVTAAENTATSSAPTEEDMNTVEKVDAQLARMEQNWAETRSGPFPEGIRNAIADLRFSLEKQDTETATASEPSDLAVDVQHVTTTTTTAIPAPTNTAIPAIYEALKTPERLERATDARHVTVAPAPVQIQTEVKLTPIPTSTASAAEGRAERDKIGKKMGDERDMPPGPASGAIDEIAHKPETTTVAATSPNTAVTTGATTVEQHNTKQRNCEGLEAERLENGEERREENEEELRNEEEVKQEATTEVRTQTAGDNVSRHQSTAFDWATDVDESPGPIPTFVDHSPTERASCTPITQTNRVSPTPVSKPALVIPTAHPPRDLSGLRSGVRNPWGSLSHRRQHPYPPRNFSDLRSNARNPWGSIHHRQNRSHPVCRDLGPDTHRYSHSGLPHSRHSISPPPLTFNAQPRSYFRAEPPIQNLQIIQHPRGISSTKPKITKNIPSYPILSMDTQEHTHASHCACGAILPVYGPNRGSWRLMDSGRGRFGRRFSRRSRRRFWDWERGRSHFRGGWME
jgi:hypothetical protein